MWIVDESEKQKFLQTKHVFFEEQLFFSEQNVKMSEVLAGCLKPNSKSSKQKEK